MFSICTRTSSIDTQSYIVYFTAWVGGDPHFVTLDNTGYTFNGFGEYSLIRAPSLNVQARLGPVVTLAGKY